jgi:hypothetical protein
MEMEEEAHISQKVNGNLGEKLELYVTNIDFSTDEE